MLGSAYVPARAVPRTLGNHPFNQKFAGTAVLLSPHDFRVLRRSTSACRRGALRHTDRATGHGRQLAVVERRTSASRFPRVYDLLKPSALCRPPRPSGIHPVERGRTAHKIQNALRPGVAEGALHPSTHLERHCSWTSISFQSRLGRRDKSKKVCESSV